MKRTQYFGLAVLSVFCPSLMISAAAGAPPCENTLFSSSTPLPLAVDVNLMMAADMNGDGHLDLVVVEFLTAHILYGDGTGAFPTSQTVGLSLVPRAIAIGDINADGILDIASIGSSVQQVEFAVSQPGGTYALAPQTINFDIPGDTFTESGGITLGDLNGDSRAELAFGYSSTNADPFFAHTDAFVEVWTNSGLDNPIFQGVDTILVDGADTESGNLFPKIADMDSDTDLDIVITSTVNTLVQIFENDGLGNLSLGPFSTSNSYSRVVLGDWNNDNLLDMAGQPWFVNEVHSLLQSGMNLVLVDNHSFTGFVLRDLSTGHFDYDGTPDLVIRKSQATPEGLISEIVLVFRGIGDGTFTSPETYSFPFNMEELVSGDFDEDGVGDLVLAVDTLTSIDDLVLVINQCEPVIADFNGDGFVNVTDLLRLLGAWGPCPAPCPEDINLDGNVNVTDLLTLLGNWG